MNPFGSMIFPTLNQLIHRAEAFFTFQKKYPIITVIPFIILSLFLESLTQILYIYVCILCIYIYISIILYYIYYIHIIYVSYMYIHILYIYISTHVFNHEILAAIDGNFPWNHPQKKLPRPPAAARWLRPRGADAAAAARAHARCAVTPAWKVGFHWDFTGISLWG